MSIIIAPQYTQRNYQWTDWKVVQFEKSGVYQYNNDNVAYTIWFYDGPEVHITTIWQGDVPYTTINSGYSQAQNDLDKLDFQTNFITNANESITKNTPIVSKPDTYNFASFGQTRVAAPYTLSDLVNKYEIDARDWGQQTTGGATITYIQNQSACQLLTNASGASSATLRTNTFFRYQAGKQMVIKITGYCSDNGASNRISNWGFYDGYNGLFYSLNGTQLEIVRRTYTSGSTVDNSIVQTSWNFDILDGYGPSGINLDITKDNIYEIHLQWLGAGIVEFFINGVNIHTMDNSNIYNTPYMQTAVLPVSIESTSISAASSGGFTFVCSSVEVDGGSDPPYYTFGIGNTSDISVGLTEIPLLSIRPKLLYGGINNRMLILPFLTNIVNNGVRAYYRIIMNATLTGSSFTSVDMTSGTEYDISATSFSGGQPLFQGFLPDTTGSNTIDISQFFNRATRQLKLDAFGTIQDTLTITGISATTGSTIMRSSISWKEIR